MIITISRQYGAGGAELAKRVGERLGWRVADNEFVERVAARAGLTPEEVAEREERPPGFLDRLAWALTSASAELTLASSETLAGLEEPQLVRVTESVVGELAREGRVVLVGRGAAAVLGDAEGAIHVMVVSPVPVRIERICGRLDCDREAARRKVLEMDARRARYHREYYGREWADPVHFHVVLNTGYLGIEGAADILMREAGRRGWVGRGAAGGEERGQVGR
jgi:cytidylate kinase